MHDTGVADDWGMPEQTQICRQALRVAVRHQRIHRASPCCAIGATHLQATSCAWVVHFCSSWSKKHLSAILHARTGFPSTFPENGTVKLYPIFLRETHLLICGSCVSRAILLHDVEEKLPGNGGVCITRPQLLEHDLHEQQKCLRHVAMLDVF